MEKEQSFPLVAVFPILRCSSQQIEYLFYFFPEHWKHPLVGKYISSHHPPVVLIDPLRRGRVHQNRGEDEHYFTHFRAHLLLLLHLPPRCPDEDCVVTSNLAMIYGNLMLEVFNFPFPLDPRFFF